MNEETRTETRSPLPLQRVWARLEKRWGVTGRGALLILATFALSGFSVLELAYPIVHAIVPEDAPRWQYYTIKFLIVIPVYEVLLLVWGTILGQGRFFRMKLRKMLSFFARPFRRGGA